MEVLKINMLHTKVYILFKHFTSRTIPIKKVVFDYRGFPLKFGKLVFKCIAEVYDRIFPGAV